MAGCSSTKNAGQLVQPVRRAIAVAQDKVTSAQVHVERATRAHGELDAKLPQTPELHDLSLKVKSELDQLTQDLLDAAESLKTTQLKVDKLERDAGTIIAERDQALKEKAILARRYGKLKFVLATLAAAAAGYFLFQFKWVLSFAGPYAWIGLVVGPLAIFALVWFGLDWIL